MHDWERALAASDTLAEILSLDGASIHRRSEWSDESWSENHRANRRRARALLAREFVAPLGRSAGASLEALGLALVDYPGLRELPPPTLGQLPTAIREHVVEQWPDLVAALLDSLRVDGGITTGEQELDDDYSEDHAPIGKWVSFEGPDRRDRARFRGATPRHRRNAFLRRLLLGSGATGEQVDEFEPVLALAAFNWLRTAEPRPGWLERHQTEPWFRVRFPDLSLRRPDEVWQDASGLIVGSVVNGRHPQRTGRFVQRTQSELDADPRFRRLRSELREELSLRVGLWAEEHSAQLSPEEARRIQDLFESGVRNVLSSSTTMELGVDIGGLSGVLMTNTPPSRARYLQRAGRAGRRGEGASVTLLFARNQPFDQEVFRNFGQYLSAPMRAPSVLLERDRLALRHAYSHVLGSFFRALWEPGQSTSTMGAFRQMGDFTDSQSTTRWRSGPKPGISDQPDPPDPASPPAWWTANGSPLEAQFRWYIEHLAGHPGGLAADLRTILSNARAEGRLDDWPGFCEELLARFDESITAWRGEFDEFLAAWDLAATRPLANFLHFQLAELRERPVIAHLAEHQFLPRFGFPLGVLQLRIDVDRADGNSWALDRSGALALRSTRRCEGAGRRDGRSRPRARQALGRRRRTSARRPAPHADVLRGTLVSLNRRGAARRVPVLRGSAVGVGKPGHQGRARLQDRGVGSSAPRARNGARWHDRSRAARHRARDVRRAHGCRDRVRARSPRDPPRGCATESPSTPGAPLRVSHLLSVRLRGLRAHASGHRSSKPAARGSRPLAPLDAPPQPRVLDPGRAVFVRSQPRPAARGDDGRARVGLPGLECGSAGRTRRPVRLGLPDCRMRSGRRSTSTLGMSPPPRTRSATGWASSSTTRLRGRWPCLRTAARLRGGPMSSKPSAPGCTSTMHTTPAACRAASRAC